MVIAAPRSSAGAVGTGYCPWTAVAHGGVGFPGTPVCDPVVNPNTDL